MRFVNSRNFWSLNDETGRGWNVVDCSLRRFNFSILVNEKFRPVYLNTKFVFLETFSPNLVRFQLQAYSVGIRIRPLEYKNVMEYRKAPYGQKLYFGLNGHFCSKFNTLLRTYSIDLHPERRIWQFYCILPDLLLISWNILLALAQWRSVGWCRLGNFQKMPPPQKKKNIAVYYVHFNNQN